MNKSKKTGRKNNRRFPENSLVELVMVFYFRPSLANLTSMIRIAKGTRGRVISPLQPAKPEDHNLVFVQMPIGQGKMDNIWIDRGRLKPVSPL